MSESRWETILAAGPIGSAAVLYLLGTASCIGYLNAFGLDSSFLPDSFEKVLFQGFVSIFTPIFLPLLSTLAIVFLVLILVKVLIWSARLFFRLTKFNNEAFEEGIINMRKWGRLSVDTAAKPIRNHLNLFLSLVFLFVLSALMISSVLDGQKIAQQEIEKFKQGEGTWVMLYSPQAPSNPIRAKQIGHNSSYSAFWLGDTSLIIPDSSIEKIVVHPGPLP